MARSPDSSPGRHCLSHQNVRGLSPRTPESLGREDAGSGRCFAPPKIVAAKASVEENRTVDWPEVKYARSGDLSIAYQVIGEGRRDLVFVPFLLSPIFSWLVPEMAEFFGRLASFSRLIVFDKRGTGASDRPRVLPTLEVQMDDVRAVLDN